METQYILKPVFSRKLSPNPGSKTGLKGNSQEKTQKRLGKHSDHNALAEKTQMLAIARQAPWCQKPGLKLGKNSGGGLWSPGVNPMSPPLMLIVALPSASASLKLQLQLGLDCFAAPGPSPAATPRNRRSCWPGWHDYRYHHPEHTASHCNLWGWGSQASPSPPPSLGDDSYSS